MFCAATCHLSARAHCAGVPAALHCSIVIVMNKLFFRLQTKRFIDILCSGLALILLAPLFILVAVIVQLDVGSPVLFRQKRPGRHIRFFYINKFRTMSVKTNLDGTLLSDSNRLTPIGRTLRRLSLDELPQLWNVLCGSMSLIGPRPLLTSYLPFYTKIEQTRHEMRPGITGWAQVHGRNLVQWEDRLAYDVWYVENWSLWLDAKILAMTVGRLILSRDVVADPSACMQDLNKVRMSQMHSIQPKQLNLPVRPASVEDAPAIVSLIQASLAPELLSVTIYGCVGIIAFVRETIRSHIIHGDSTFLVAERDGQVVGCAELRINSGKQFLNYIAIKSTHRGHGLGRSLLSQAALLTLQSDIKEMTLDVSESNTLARDWYRSIGFLETECSYWLSQHPKPGSYPSFIVRGFANAQACHEKYGFSQFIVETNECRIVVGRLGKRFFRLLETRAATRDNILGLLYQIDPNRTIVSLSNFRPSPKEADTILLQRSWRASIPINTLLKVLEPLK